MDAPLPNDDSVVDTDPGWRARWKATPRSIRVVTWLSGFLLIPTTFYVGRLIKEMTLWTWQRGPQMVGFSLAHGHGNPLTIFGCLTTPLMFVSVPILAGLLIRAAVARQVVSHVAHGVALTSFAVLALSTISARTWTRLTYRIAGPGPGGVFALAEAAQRCDVELFESLLAQGVPVDPPDERLRQPGFGTLTDTPLLAVASAGRECVPVARRLIALRVDLDRRSSISEQPAIVGACYPGHRRLIELLVAAGADVNVPDGRGRTALDVAVENDHVELAEWLRAHGARPGSGSP